MLVRVQCGMELPSDVCIVRVRLTFGCSQCLGADACLYSIYHVTYCQIHAGSA